jgi:hypothetical protein
MADTGAGVCWRIGNPVVKNLDMRRFSGILAETAPWVKPRATGLDRLGFLRKLRNSVMFWEGGAQNHLLDGSVGLEYPIAVIRPTANKKSKIETI